MKAKGNKITRTLFKDIHPGTSFRHTGMRRKQNGNNAVSKGGKSDQGYWVKGRDGGVSINPSRGEAIFSAFDIVEVRANG